MNIFSIFSSKGSDSAIEQPIKNLPIEENQVTGAEVNSQEPKSDGMVTITYGTGMPIDLIYNFLRHSYETDGYNDALISPENAYKEMNVKRLRGLLELKFQQVRLRYESNIKIMEQRIETCNDNGLFVAMNNMTMQKELYLHHLDKLTEMENDYKQEKSYMTTFITSYENGFLRGIASVAVGMNGFGGLNEKEG